MNILTHILNTIFNFYQRKFNLEWSNQLSKIIDCHDSVKITEYAVIFTVNSVDIEVWIKNKFYSYGYARYVDKGMVDFKCQFRPSFKVINKLNNLELKLRSEKEIEDTKNFNEKMSKIITPKD